MKTEDNPLRVFEDVYAVIKDRKLLSTDGMVAVLIPMDSRTQTILKKPEIITQGFIG